MNSFNRALSAMINWLVQAGQLLVGVYDNGGYRAPAAPALEPMTQYLPPVLTVGEVQANLTNAPVSLVKAPNLVRPFVGPLSAQPVEAWRGHPPLRPRATISRRVRFAAPLQPKPPLAAAFDALGLPVGRALAKDDSPTLGFFEQTVEAWRLRTGNRNVSWA